MLVTLSGATDFLGTALISRLLEKGHRIRLLTRTPRTGLQAGVELFLWDAAVSEPPADSLSGSDAVIHLSGESVSQRWTEGVKRRIETSRVNSTRLLVQALSTLSRRPPIFLCASAIGIYGFRGDEILSEAAGPGDGFLARVSVEWEKQANLARALGLRVNCLRTGIVLHKSEGALGQMLPAFRAGLGGKLSGGQQWMSWLHTEDWVGIVEFLLLRETQSGPVNLTAPHPVRNTEFTKVLGQVLQRPALFTIPRFALKILFGEMADVILESQRVLPVRMAREGYEFRHPQLEPALRNLLL